MLVAGAVVGRCVITAAWPTASAKPPREAGLTQLGSCSGQALYFGDALDRYIVPYGGVAGPTLWDAVRGAATNAGASAGDMPGIPDMFQHVMATIGTSRFGVARTAGRHQPAATAGEVLDAVWPRFRRLFESQLHDDLQAFGPPVLHWPLVANLAAGNALKLVQYLLDPAVGARIAMEAAIAGAKIDPHAQPRAQPARSGWRLRSVLNRWAMPATAGPLAAPARSMSPDPSGRR